MYKPNAIYLCFLFTGSQDLLGCDFNERWSLPPDVNLPKILYLEHLCRIRQGQRCNINILTWKSFYSTHSRGNMFVQRWSTLRRCLAYMNCPTRKRRLKKPEKQRFDMPCKVGTHPFQTDCPRSWKCSWLVRAKHAPWKLLTRCKNIQKRKVCVLVRSQKKAFVVWRKYDNRGVYVVYV